MDKLPRKNSAKIFQVGPPPPVDPFPPLPRTFYVASPPQRQPKKRAPAKKAAKKRAARKPGRPTLYSETLTAEICRRLHESEEGEIPESLRQICRDPMMPALSTVCDWLRRHAEFSERYARARELRKDALVERLMKISQDARTHAHGAPATGEAAARVQAIKLEIDTLKWILGKEYARDYGDRVNLEHTGPGGGPLRTEAEYRVTPEDERMLKRIAEKRAELQPGEEG